MSTKIVNFWSAVAVLAIVVSVTAVLLPSGALAANSNIYEFRFVNGTVISGEKAQGDINLDSDHPEVSWPTSGLTLHISCSETYPDGWESDGGFPNENDYPNWRIESFEINRTIGNGKNVHCGEVEKEVPGNIVVIKKVTEGSDSSKLFTFQTTGGGYSEFTLSADEGSHDSGDLTAGEYSVYEVNPGGWTFNGVVCDSTDEADESVAASIQLNENETVTCTFTNAQDEEPILGCTDPEANNYNPEATKDDGSCTYDEPPILGCTDPEAWNYDETATKDDDSCVYDACSNIYGFQESIPEGYEDSDEDGICTEIPADKGNIVVKKLVTEGSDTEKLFTFSPSWTESFSLSHNQLDSFVLDAGDYSVLEAIPEGWTLESATCDSTKLIDFSTPSSIDLDEGETITCTFVNDEVNEPILGCTDPSAHNYNESATEDDGSCTYDACSNIDGFQESIPEGYEDPEQNNVCTEIVFGCTDSEANNYDEAATQDDGTCSYGGGGGNDESRIVIRKITDSPGTEEFEFDSSWTENFFVGHNSTKSFELDPGTYSVDEINLPGLWELDSVGCTSSIGDTETNTAIGLDENEVVTCVFSNFEYAGGGGGTSSGGGGGGGRSRTPEPEILGEQINLIPEGAPNAGFGVSVDLGKALIASLSTILGLFGLALATRKNKLVVRA